MHQNQSKNYDIRQRSHKSIKKKQIVKVKNNALATDKDSHREGDGK